MPKPTCERPARRPAARTRRARRRRRARASARGAADRPSARRRSASCPARGTTRITSSAVVPATTAARRSPRSRPGSPDAADPDSSVGAWLSRVRTHVDRRPLDRPHDPHPVGGRVQGAAGRPRRARSPAEHVVADRRRGGRGRGRRARLSRSWPSCAATASPTRPSGASCASASADADAVRGRGRRPARRGHRPRTARSACWSPRCCAATASSSPGWPTTRSSA